MQNDLQSPEDVIQGVDTHLMFISVLLSVRQVNCLVPALFKPLKLAIWNYLIGLNIFGFLSELASKDAGTYGAALTCFIIKNGVEVNRPARSKRRLEGKSASSGC